VPLIRPSMIVAAARLSRHIAYERLFRPKARVPGDIPWSVDAITPEWLTAIVCAAHPAARVTDFEVIGGSSGTNVRHRLALHYNEAGRAAGLPATLFAKSTPTLMTRMLTGITGQSRVEAQFYTRVRPLLDLEMPVALHSAWDPVSLRTMHLLEDLLATRGAVFTDYRTKVTLPMAEDMVDLLAAFHGRFLGKLDSKGDIRLPGYARWFMAGIDKLNVDKANDAALDRARDHIPDDVARRWSEVLPATIRSLDVHRDRTPTYIHSDVHIGNWYRTGDGRMGLSDWQCGARGHWSRDLAYALVAALDVADRRRWERELVRRYLDRLQGHGAERPDFDDSFRLYRAQMFSALFMWTPTLVHSALLPNMQSDACSLTMIARMTTAISDLDSFEACS
jgi:hypothetical protein